MLAIGAAVVFVAVAVIFFVKRHELAHLQALLAGGSIVPGCAVAEGILFLALAIVVLVAWRMGAFGG